jgi:hypothetical protein
MNLHFFKGQDPKVVLGFTEDGILLIELKILGYLAGVNATEFQNIAKRLHMPNWLPSTLETTFFVSSDDAVALLLIYCLDNNQDTGAITLLQKFASHGAENYLTSLLGEETMSEIAPDISSLDWQVAIVREIVGMQHQIPPNLCNQLYSQVSDLAQQSLQSKHIQQQWVGLQSYLTQLGYKPTPQDLDLLTQKIKRSKTLPVRSVIDRTTGKHKHHTWFLESEALRLAIHDYFAIKRL